LFRPQREGQKIWAKLLKYYQEADFRILEICHPLCLEDKKMASPRALAGVHWKATGAEFNKPENATFHPRTQLNDALIES
jgi:succinyl-CoA synthetase beta subunit